METTFRYSDSSLCAYLLYLGYFPIGFDVVEKRGNKPKVFIHFNGNKDELLTIYNEYKQKNLELNLVKYTECKNQILKMVKEQLKKHYKN